MHPKDLIEEKFRLNPFQKEGLKKLGLKNLQDLLFYLPSRYGDKAELKHIDEVKNGELAVVCGKVLSTKISKSFRGGVPMAEMVIEDDSGKIKAIWFHQPYMAKKVPEGKFAKLTGQIIIKKTGRSMVNPELEETGSAEIAHHGSLFAGNTIHQTPVYPETRGVSSLWLQHAIDKLLKNKIHESIEDIIPDTILTKYHLPSLQTALVWIHTPQKDSDAIAARKRFSFEEVFLIQLVKLKERKEYESNPSFKISTNEKEIKNFTERFGFKMTSAQTKATEQITNNFRESKPMTRLLEGDVGSGKTAVAATATYSIINTSPYGKDFGNLQVAYMAPTEILANQHFESFIKYFKHTGISVGLITGSGCKKFPSKTNAEKWTAISRSQLLKWVANGEIPILIGTHSLIQKTVKFKHLGLVIIDEQHRFGVDQRLRLAKKTSDFIEGKKLPVPHLLSMTATPIPRTLALTIYGDLDLTLLDEMPVGRKPIITNIVTPTQREDVYKKIKEEIKNSRQAYIICPRIDEPDPDKELALNTKSVKAEAKRLKKDVFQECEIEILHSKMTPKEKEKVMDRFSLGKINILVATSVVEVGVNVPNATLIIIEGGERFGLSQLHQLRGRVLRSNHQAYCYIFSESRTEKTWNRLRAIKTAKNGFELAEMDLSLRGFGELCGGKQWGISDIGMDAIKNIKMVEAARNEAKDIIDNDPEMKRYPELREKTKGKKLETHFE
ncbi:MAG: ATP-dependent DNA helicase RecG [Parcubacteria group bacterium GW2011_GWF2_38_76]|nr:MAG: ATP-dependent DNA helicase RecG [Parcubacteria group bacterium GW2011_GWF2_38_76]HBM45470.1 ATP-dependent DNA helicase RecG [Patescibacteria group bacterium]